MKIETAVAVIINDDTDEVLLGKSNADDDRNGLWVFPGGGIEEGEDVKVAAKREGYQETGIWAEPTDDDPIISPSKPKVAFVLLHPIGGEINPNHEFDEMKWFKLNKLPKDVMSLNAEVLQHFYKTLTEKLIAKVRAGMSAIDAIEETMSRADKLALSPGSYVELPDGSKGYVKDFAHGGRDVEVTIYPGKRKKIVKISDLTLLKARP